MTPAEREELAQEFVKLGRACSRLAWAIRAGGRGGSLGVLLEVAGIRRAWPKGVESRLAAIEEDEIQARSLYAPGERRG